MADQHALFVAAAYAVTALIVGGLILRAILDHRAQRRALAGLEARGPRRSRDPGRRADPAPESPR